jgi:hypothetical protein
MEHHMQDLAKSSQLAGLITIAPELPFDNRNDNSLV